MSRFNKGFILGGLVGAIVMWFGVTPRGKELRAKVGEHLEPLLKEVRESLRQLEGPTREMYDALVERIVEEYAAQKELAIEIKNRLVKELKQRWTETHSKA
jgi:gas vesicle protein